LHMTTLLVRVDIPVNTGRMRLITKWCFFPSFSIRN